MNFHIIANHNDYDAMANVICCLAIAQNSMDDDIRY